MSMHTRLGCYLAIGFVFALTGCSLAIKECKKAGDCAAPYQCGGAGFCELQGCKEDADCRQPGICDAELGRCQKAECVASDDCADGELCNTQDKRCVKKSEAVCETSAAQCMAYEGAQVCRKRDKLCVESECAEPADCGTSPTVKCSRGSCVDAQWGCLGERDPRPATNMSSAGSLEVKVLHATPASGELETGVRDLSVRVCQFNDVNCGSSVSDDWDYKDNILTIRGLENGKNYAIRLQATNPLDIGAKLLETEYQMYRTIVGKTVDLQPIVMFDAAFRALAASAADLKSDPELGNVLAYVLDCEGKEIAGVSVGVDKVTVGCMGDEACTTTVFYFTAGNVPDPAGTKTSLAGRLGVANVRPGVLNRLTLTRVDDNKKLTSFAVRPRANVMTYTFFYPNDFGTAAE